LRGFEARCIEGLGLERTGGRNGQQQRAYDHDRELDKALALHSLLHDNSCSCADTLARRRKLHLASGGGDGLGRNG
jgi:hypothetical protein